MPLPKTRNLIHLCGILLVTLTSFGTRAQSAEPSVDAFLVSKRLPLGEQGQLVVRIANGRPEALPGNVVVDGLTITRSERVEQKFSLGSSGNQAEFHFYYAITADRAGEFIIPGIPAKVDGKELTTEPVTLTVYERDPSDPALDASRPYFANLECPNREIWAGQMVPVTLAIYVRGVRSINDIGPPILRHDAFVFEYERSYTLDGLELDGITFSTAKRPGYVFGLTPGNYSIGPAEIQVAMIDDSSPFGRMPGFFQSFVAKTLRTNPVSITVKPLPEVGRPSNFKNAVGKFTVSVKASPLKVAVGDPITLDFEVNGPGNYETLEAPVFLSTDAAQWRTYDARKTVDPAEVSDGVKSGRAQFNQIVMPQAQVTEIPAFELTFFNPETGAYESQRTEPIPIQVTADTRVAGGVAIPSAGGPTAMPPGGYTFDAAATPEAQFNDIVHIRTTPPKWRPMPASVTSRPLFWVGQIVPALALISLIGVGVARRVKTRRRQRRQRTTVPFKTAYAAVHSATSRGEYYHAIVTALDSWNTEAGPASVKSMPDSIKSAVDALRSRSQWILYGASDADQARAPDPQEMTEAGQILDALRHHLS